MSNLCKYRFVAGSKKGKRCNRFLRKGGDTYCYQHRAKRLVNIKEGSNAKEEPKPVPTPEIDEEQFYEDIILSDIEEIKPIEVKESSPKKIPVKPKLKLDKSQSVSLKGGKTLQLSLGSSSESFQSSDSITDDSSSYSSD